MNFGFLGRPSIVRTHDVQSRLYVACMIKVVRAVTSTSLAGIAAVHVAWGVGSSFPFSTRAELADAVIGTEEVPPPAACFAVAGLLFVAAGVVAGRPRSQPRLRRMACVGASSVLALRGGVGLSGHTDALSPGSNSQRFLELDRRVYSPLCLALAAGTAWSIRDEKSSLHR